ncbi:MAG: DNRLRE domain-containing protein [Bacteroidota bacterium]|nr:DNRLRE domain-containing protein [Bacteroidota bacterium]
MKNFLLLLITSFLIFGCSDDPSSIGEKLLPDQDHLQTNAFNTNASYSFFYGINASNNSSTLLLGKYVGAEANMLLQFGIGIIDTSIADSILSAEIKMFQNYSTPDTVGNLNFKFHKMDYSWTDYTFTVDTLKAKGVGAFITDISKEVRTRDTLPVTFQIPLSIVQNWLKGATNNGIIFIPKPDMQNIFGFHSYYLGDLDDKRPQLIVTYRKTSDTSDKTLIFKTSQDATVFSGAPPASTSELLYVQGGLINRGKLYFKVDSIPRSSTITQAFLTVKIDTTLSKFSQFSDRQFLVHEITTQDSIPRLGSLTASNKPTADSIVIDVRRIVQKWAAGKSNFGVALRTFNEFTEFERFAVFGFNAVETKRPKLTIQYTYLP